MTVFRHLSWLLPTSTVVALCACQPSNDNTSSRLEHVANEPVPEALSILWHESTRHNHILMTENGLSASHPAVARVQYWLERFDTVLREKHGDKLAYAPKPQAHVISGNINAYVMPYPRCYSIPVVFEGGGMFKAKATLFFKGVFESKPTLSMCGASDNTQPTLSANADEVAMWVDFLMRNQEKSLSGCRLRFDGTTVFASKQCKGIDDMSAANVLILPSLSNFVTVQDKLLHFMENENQLAAVLAHELGHYYRAHMMTGGFYGYFYNHGPKNNLGLPPQNRELVELSRKLRHIEIYTPAQDIPGAQKSVEISLAMLNMLAQYPSYKICAKGSECLSACHNFEEFARQFAAPSLEKIGRTRTEPLTQNNRAVYLKAEDLFLKCAQQIPIRKEGAGWGGMTRADFWIFNDGPVKVNFTSLRDTKTLANVVDAYSAGATAQISENFKLVEEARSVRFGFYTEEQEADEFAAELLADAGISPEVAVDTNLRLASDEKDTGSLFNPLSHAECVALRAHNWQDALGNDVFVSIGTFDVHHAGCYRAWNVSREIAAHQYAVSAKEFPPPPGGTWGEIISSLIVRKE